jgi:hypothetical protein
MTCCRPDPFASTSASLRALGWPNMRKAQSRVEGPKLPAGLERRYQAASGRLQSRRRAAPASAIPAPLDHPTLKIIGPMQRSRLTGPSHVSKIHHKRWVGSCYRGEKTQMIPLKKTQGVPKMAKFAAKPDSQSITG